MLQQRLKDIVSDVGRHIKDGNNISEVLLFKDKIANIVSFCFQNNKSIQNILHNTLESILIENENAYSKALAHKIIEEDIKDSEVTIHHLFKLIPNKEKFIRQF